MFQELIKIRQEFVPKILEARKKFSTSRQAEFLDRARQRLLSDSGFEFKKYKYLCADYLQASDIYTSGFGINTDRTHGEHHKFDVVYFGTKIVTTLDFSFGLKEGALLLIVLNEHDEGRRIAGDAEHEIKSGELIRMRMMNYPTFTHQEIEDCVIAVKSHKRITGNSRYRPQNTRQKFLYAVLMLADKISGLDPLRHTAYAVKHNCIKDGKKINWVNFIQYYCKRSITSLKEALTLSPKFANLLPEAESLERKFTLFINVLFDDLDKSDNDTFIKYVNEGNDVKLFNKTFNIKPPIPAMPIYSRS